MNYAIQCFSSHYSRYFEMLYLNFYHGNNFFFLFTGTALFWWENEPEGQIVKSTDAT
jgi:hypothetical protein